MKNTRVPLTLGGFIATGLAMALHPATPTSQEPLSPLSVSATRAADLRHTAATVERLRRGGDLRVTDIVQDPLLPHRTHQRLAQYHQGVRVIGADLTVQTEEGIATSAFGQIYPDISLDVVPRLSVDEVLMRANPDGLRSLTAPPTLAVVLDRTTSSYRLVHELQTFGPDGLLTTQIDAATGALVTERYALRTQTTPLPCSDCAVGEGRGVKGDRKKISVRARSGTFTADDGLRPARISTYDLGGDWSRSLDVLFGHSALSEADLAADTDNDWRDGVNVDAHVGSGWTLDYLYHRFGHGGLDGRNSPVTVLVHPIDRAALFTAPGEVVALFHVNAFFCGTCGPHGMVVFGEGLPPGQSLGTGQTLDFFAAGIDIVAHELGHAVIEFSSGLVYEGESGALSEAFSDLIGVGTEFFMAESGRHPAEQADYLVGEDVVKPGGVRSLSNPLARGDPDHYSIRFLGASDNGGVHTNSTIVSHVYYLAVEGGVNRTSGLAVNGLGANRRELVEQIFFRSFSLLLPTSATFSMARAATLQSARDLSGDEAVEQTIAAAWTAVGVE